MDSNEIDALLWLSAWHYSFGPDVKGMYVCIIIIITAPYLTQLKYFIQDNNEVAARIEAEFFKLRPKCSLSLKLKVPIFTIIMQNGILMKLFSRLVWRWRENAGG